MGQRGMASTNRQALPGGHMYVKSLEHTLSPHREGPFCRHLHCHQSERKILWIHASNAKTDRDHHFHNWGIIIKGDFNLRFSKANPHTLEADGTMMYTYFPKITHQETLLFIYSSPF